MSDGNVVFNGTVEPVAELAVAPDESSFVNVVVDGSEAWTFTPALPLSVGSHTFRAVAREDAFNLTKAATFTFAVDSTALLAPVITGLPNGFALPTTTPTFTGTAEPGADVLVSVDGSLVGPATAQADEVWTFQIASPLNEGAHTVHASARDSAGNTSADSNTMSFQLDITAPTVTSVVGPTAGAYGAGGLIVDTVGPTVVLSAPAGVQTGPFTLTITFS